MNNYCKDIILNSNLSIRRNIEGYDFPSTMTLEYSIEIIEKMRQIYNEELILIDELNDDQLNHYINSYVLSRDARNRLSQIGLVIKDDYIISINDRDHIAINIIDFDMDIKQAYKKALEIEEFLDERLDFAFSPEFGYFTQDGRNTGSGLEIFIKMYLFAMLDSHQAFFGFSQAMINEGIFVRKYVDDFPSDYMDQLVILKNVGNYRSDMDSYIEKFEDNIDTLVRNERRFRKDFLILNKVTDEEIEDRVKIILNNLNSSLLKNKDQMEVALYDLKKYNNLGFYTDLSNDEIDHLIFNINKIKYKANKDPDRYQFLNDYMQERKWKIID